MIILLYNSDLNNWLIDSIIDITCCLLSIGGDAFFVIMAAGTAGMSVGDSSAIAVLTRFFLSCLLSLNSPIATILFINGLSIGYFLRSFALGLDSLMKSSLAMMTYLI